MLKNKNLYILGYSGHAYVVLDIALSENYHMNGYFDFKQAAKNPYSLDYCGNETEVDLKSIVKEDYIFPAIGANKTREKLFLLLQSLNLKQPNLISQRSFVSPKAIFGTSNLVCPKAVINSFVQLGNACIINTGAIVEHECIIGDYSHIAPSAVLAGNVTVGKNVFIGANAVIKEGITIVDDVVIGAGAVVIKDISEKGTWVGNPAKKVK